MDGYLGFGQRVTGGAAAEPTEVGSLDELTAAIKAANNATEPTVIVVTKDIAAEDAERTYELTGRRLTIYGNPGKSLDGIGFVVTESADDILFQNLTFRVVKNDGKEPYPDDSIVFRTRRAAGEVGFLIDHCTFEAVPDMNVQTSAEEPGDEWLLLSIADCRFEGDPRRNGSGSVEIAGNADQDGSTYAVNASVLRCCFVNARRRSPRSSRGTFVHAYNNVLRNWGAAGDDDKQSNGMASGAGGQLAVIANWFDAGDLKLTVEVRPAKDGDPAGLVQHASGGVDTNVYEDRAYPPDQNDDLDIDVRYTTIGLDAPVPLPMTEELADTIRDEAGATLGAWGTAPSR